MSEEKRSTANGAGDGDHWSIERVAAEPERTRRWAVEVWLAQSPTRTALLALAEAEVDAELRTAIDALSETDVTPRRGAAAAGSSTVIVNVESSSQPPR